MQPSELVALLKDPNSTLFQKAIACKKLAVVGGPDAVRPMAALLSHPQLACYARFGMEPSPSPSVDVAFRAALPKLNGKLQMGVIHSIGFRKDVNALGALKRLIGDRDAQVAGAAAAAVGMIGGLEAGRILESALKDTASPVFPVIARACLLCAEGLMANNRARALQLYSQLSAKSMPGPVQLAALRVLNAAGPAPAYTKPWAAPSPKS
jgi:HEAT repeat protein